MRERTFVMVKPDGVQRGLVGDIVSRFESRGFRICGAKMMKVPRELAERTPPPMADPREPIPEVRGEVARTPLGDSIDERKDAREKQLKARGELLR